MSSPTLARRLTTEHDYTETIKAINHLRAVADVHETLLPPGSGCLPYSHDLARALASAERAAKRIVELLQVRIGGLPPA